MGRIEEALRKAKVSRGVELKETAPKALNNHARPKAVSDRAPLDLKKSNLPSGHVFHADKAMLREQRVIAASEHDERVGSYRQLRTLLLKTMRDNDWSTLAITSAHKGAGKSVTSTNLAISLSRDVNTTVLLVDLDLNTPTVHEKLGLKTEQGLVDFLEGNAELEDIVFDPGIDGLMVLAGRSAGKEMSELLASPKLQQLVADLHRQDATSVTIFDLPPLLRNDDAILFAPYADAVLVVVEDGVTTEKQLRHALQLLDKANVIGTIINKARY